MKTDDRRKGKGVSMMGGKVAPTQRDRKVIIKTVKPNRIRLGEVFFFCLCKNITSKKENCDKVNGKIP